VARAGVLDAEVEAADRRAAVVPAHRLQAAVVVVPVPAGRPVADELRRVDSRW
jgi:hypothetical protein